MNLVSFMFVAGVLIFLRLFYLSFMSNEDIYLYFYTLNNLELMILFYIFLLAMLYALMRKIQLNFVVVQFLFSISLLIVGEYTYFLFLQFVFLFMLFESKKSIFKIITFSLYLLALHKGLLLLFSSYFLLYFIDLIFLVYTVFLKTELLERFKETRMLPMFIILVIALGVVLNIQDFIFEFYIWLGLDDVQNYQVNMVMLMLSFIHILIFFVIKRIDFKLV